MGSLRRVRLKTRINEASALLRAHSPGLLSHLDTDQAWWIAHDEAGLDAMVSVVCSVPGVGQGSDESWQVTTLQLTAGESNPILTDAEALAFSDGFVFVFGSSFVGPKGLLDERRSFVARFSEHDVTTAAVEATEDDSKKNDRKKGDSQKRGDKKTKKQSPTTLSAPVSVLDLGTHLTRSINTAIEAQELQLLKPHSRVAKQVKKSIKAGADLDPEMQPINIEGAAFIGDDLVLGLRWPVSSHGQPLVARISGARPVLLSDTWTAEALADCPTTVHPVDVGTPKRPAGIRGMTIDPEQSGGTVHLITGPTEREMTADKVQAAAYQHLRTNMGAGAAAVLKTELLQTFEGYRKVEAVAPFSPPTEGSTNNTDTDSARWIYGLDDEDAIVLLIQT